MVAGRAMNRPVPFTVLHRAPRLIGRGLLTLYRYTLGPLLGPRCRHLPSCSDYAEEALGRFGLWAGGWMTLARVLRCQRWGTSGLDFVPAKLPAWASGRKGRTVARPRNETTHLLTELINGLLS